MYTRAKTVMLKIAAITVSYNEEYQLAAFSEYYLQYCDQLYKHIIVDNGSKPGYVAHLREEFPDSFIITRSENGGTTSAFNEGIRYALEDPNVEGILLIVQDVQISPLFLENLSSLLTSDPTIAGASGVVFSAGTENLVESYGGKVDWNHFVLYPHYNGAPGTHELPDLLEVDFLPGGITLVRRDAFEKVGLQDERLFMYCDELDWTFRAKRSGYRLVVSKLSQAWHQHTKIIDPRQRQLRANFYTFRNRVYLIGKHHGRSEMLRYWATSTRSLFRRLISRMIRSHVIDAIVVSQILGLFYGVLGLMGRQLYAGE